MIGWTDEKGGLWGKIFGDLGADVIKVEPPEGCSTRQIPPFLDDIPGQDRSLYAIAYHEGKRSITLNLESADGRTLLAELVRRADFIVESVPFGYMESLGLGYNTLAKLNPRLIYTSITPFGDTGPAKHYKAADIVTWAAGGMMYLTGDEGRPPLELSLPQAGLHAGAEAAVASLIAHYPREIAGLAQQIVVDIQACILWTLMNEQAMPIFHGDHLRRSGIFTGATGGSRKTMFRCKDGFISGLLAGGPYLPSTNATIEWMREEDAAPEWLTREGGLKYLTPEGIMSANT